MSAAPRITSRTSFVAASKGDSQTNRIETGKLLIQRGAQVNTPDEQKRAALHYAIPTRCCPRLQENKMSLLGCRISALFLAGIALSGCIKSERDICENGAGYNDPDPGRREDQEIFCHPLLLSRSANAPADAQDFALTFCAYYTYKLRECRRKSPVPSHVLIGFI